MNIQFRKADGSIVDLSLPMTEIEGQGLGVISAKFNRSGTSKYKHLKINRNGLFITR